MASPPPHASPDPAGQAPISRARASFRTVVDLTSDLVLIHRDGRALYFNPAAVRALAVASSDQLAGAPIADVFHPADRGAIEAPVRATAEAQGEKFSLRWRTAGGAYRMTEATAASVEFEGVSAVIVVGRDVTERAEFQHQLMARDRMAALGTLSAGVAHEINNPLTYLLANLEHVLRRLRAASASDDPIEELTSGSSSLSGLTQSLQQAGEGANQVRRIVRDLLTFARGNIEHRGMVDVRGILESATQMAWHEIRHRARLVKSLADTPLVDANEARLGQVFINLLVNAAQAIPEGHADKHEVRVATRTDDRGYAIVEVSDTGTGIAPENMSRIFDPFFTTKGEGTGLGLSTSHGVVTSLGGEINVTSTLGKGTTFVVALPPATTTPAPFARPAGAHEFRTPRRRVLVVDDERLVGEAIARVLAEENEVDVVTDARQALSRLAAGERYDVLLCDLMMPVMTGMDLYAEIVRTSPKLAGCVVFMTGGAFTPRAHAFLESVANPWLEKPLDTGKLRSVIARVGSAAGRA